MKIYQNMDQLRLRHVGNTIRVQELQKTMIEGMTKIKAQNTDKIVISPLFRENKSANTKN